MLTEPPQNHVVSTDSGLLYPVSVHHPNEVIRVEPDEQKISRNRYGRFYTRRIRHTSIGNGALHTVPIVFHSNEVARREFLIDLSTHATTGRRAGRSRRTSFDSLVQPIINQIRHTSIGNGSLLFHSNEVARSEFLIDFSTHATTGRRASRSRRTSFDSLVQPISNQIRHTSIGNGAVHTVPIVFHSNEVAPRQTITGRQVVFSASNAPHASNERVVNQAAKSASAIPLTPETLQRNKRVANQAIDSARRKKARAILTIDESSSLQATDRTRRRIARGKQTLEEHISEQVVNSGQRKMARQAQTTENQGAQRAIDTARRRIARQSQSDGDLAVRRALNNARKKKRRASQTNDQRAAQQACAFLQHILWRQRQAKTILASLQARDNVRRRLARTYAKRTISYEIGQSSHSHPELDTARQRQSDEYLAVRRALNNARHKNMRACQTNDQRAAQQACAFLQHILWRQRQAKTYLASLQARDTVRRRLARTRARRTIFSQIGESSHSHPEIVNIPVPLSNAQNFRKSCREITWVSCTQCNTRFLDIKISSGICKSCLFKTQTNCHTHMFSASNLMDPGVVPLQLSRLSNLEMILIARVHPMMSVYRVKGQQYKYSGNVINFAQDVNAIATVLPYKPADLSAILIVNRAGKHAIKEFRVRREFVRQALVWLKVNHLYYRDIIIDEVTLADLPLDGTPEDIPHALNDDLQLPHQEDDNEGPPELHTPNVCIDQFQTVGTLLVGRQQNQQTCIKKALQVPDVDQTIVNMPFTTQIIDEFNTPGYITMVFPTLFPYGHADLRQARPRKINPSEYFQYLMKYIDGRYARDSRFRYFSWNSLSRWRALSLGDVYIQKNPTDGDLSIEDIKQMVSSGDKQLANRISYYAKNIRGTRAYWYTRLKELTAMVKQLGAPTIFFTLSAADLQWPELYHLLDPTDDLQSMPPAEQRKGRAKLLNENPYVVAWFFHTRVDLFLHKFLSHEFSVIDHWYRYEWQNRGSGHVHGFLWLKDSPNVTRIATNVRDRLKIVEYFERLVCTENLNADMSIPIQDNPCARLVPMDENLDTNEEDYASLINWVMRHSKCGNYCLRSHKTTKQMVCRFRYPFDVLDKSEIIEEPLDSNMFRYMGRRNDPLVCSHNRKVLQTWRANIDWSPVLSVQSVVNYIAKYAAKSEPASKNFTATLREIIEDIRRPCQTAKSAIKRLLMKSVSERDISAQEVCHLLMGYPLARSSRKIVLLNLSENSLLSSTVRRRGIEDEEVVGTDPSFVSRYMQRPSKYDGTSLLDMAKKHYFIGNRWHTSRVDAIVRLIPEFDSDIAQNSAKWELYCRQQVLLRQHYRSLEEAKGDFESWSAQYIHLGLAENLANFLPEPTDHEFEDGLEMEIGIEDLQREEWMMAARMGPMFVPGEDVDLGMRDLDVSHNWAEGLDRFPNIDSERRFVHNHLRCDQEEILECNSLVVQLDQLSIEQKVAHDMVIKSLQNKTSIRLIVCGGAGTGKSTLINAIVHSAIAILGTRKTVRIMAPTGVAAFNVGGATIHHELAISPERKPSQPYRHITGDQCRRMQEDFKDTKLIIIDEYSMLGRSMLANIDLRCRDIFANNESFGNVSVLLVGDMRQLPPVFDSPLYVRNGGFMQQCGGITYSGFEKCVRLSQIFRQAGDQQASFREALRRLSDGTSTINDWHLFRTRDCSILAPFQMKAFKNALRLFPTKQAAHNYNRDRLVQLGKPVARILSKNNCETASKALPDDAKGLENVLCLSVGSRVMLRANLSTQNGLVNGSMGYVVDIVYALGCKPPIDMPLAVMVDFDNYRGPNFQLGTNIIPITPQTSNWKSSSGTSCQRTQLPLLLCWAITIHKSQGLTLDRVVVDIGDRESLGLTFVALSRTRKLCDLAFSPMFTFERLQRIGKCSGLRGRLLEEERLRLMSLTSN